MRMSTLAFNCFELSTGFWCLKPSSKRNTLSDRHHKQLIIASIVDVETRIEQIDRTTYTIYDNDCSLLIQASSPAILSALTLFCNIPHYTN